MANQYKNKIIYNGSTLIDISSDTVTAAVLATGYTAHDASGAPIVGTYAGGGGDYAWVEELGLSVINGTVNVTYETT